MPDEYFRPSREAQPTSIASSPATGADGTPSRPFAIGGFLAWGPLAYAVLAAVALGACPYFPVIPDAVSEWIAVPIQLLAIALCVATAVRHLGLSGLTRVDVHNGAISVTFGNFANTAVAGKVLTLQPLVVTGSPASPTSWRCGYRAAPRGMEVVGENQTNVNLQFLPTACRA